MIFSKLTTKINQLFGYTPSQAQLLANPDLLEIAVDACGVNVASLTDIANSLNTLLGTSYTGSSLASRPDLIKLGLKSLQANLPDGASINGVQNFYRSTKPVARADGGALVIGDRWIDPSNGNVAYWNGTYWVSPSLFTYTNPPGNLVSLAATAANTGFLSAPVQNTYDILLQKVNYVIATSVNQTASNNWNIALFSLTSNNSNNQYGSTYNTFANWALQANVITSVSAIHNAVIANTTLGSCRDFRHTFTLNNAGGTLTVYQASVVYQLIYG